MEMVAFVKKYFPILLITSVAAGLAAFALALNLPPSYEATQTLFVKRQAAGESKQFYTYDGYYSAQAAERFADSVYGALKSPPVLRFAITRVGGEEITEADLDKKIRAFKVVRLSPQLISFSYRNSDRAQAQKLVSDLATSVSQMAADLESGGDSGISISFVSPEPLVVTKTLNPLLSGLAGFLLGGFFSMAASALHFYFRNLPR